MDGTITSYINTLIFCIIAKAVTLIFLVMLLTDIGWEYKWFVLTVEICLVMIISYTLYKVYKFQKAIDDAAKAAAVAPPMVTTCPDYFVQNVDADGNQICDNTYMTKNTSFKFTSGPNTPVPTQNMTEIIKDKKSMNEFCTGQADNIQKFAWTDVKARCGFLDAYV